jgi:uncharacterized membrane protein
MKMKINPIYDAKYYQVKEIISDPGFVNDINDLLKRFHDFGCPVPKSGFRKYSDFDNWQRTLWKKYDDHIKNMSIQNDIPIVVYGQVIDRVLKKYGLDPKNKDDKYWIEQFIFFKKKEYEKPLALIKYIPPISGKDPELWIRYFGHTKPSDIKVEKILEYQKLLPDYKGKNKPKDLKILQRNKIVAGLYQKEKNKDRGNVYSRERRIKGQSISQFVVNKLKKKYPELNKTLVEQIVKIQAEK